MRISSILLGLALVAGFGVASPLYSSSLLAQEDASVASPAEQATFDESLLEIPEGESSKFYLKRFTDIQKAFNTFNGDREQLMKLMPKANAAMTILVKKLAVADDLEPSQTTQFFINYAYSLFQEGELDELRTLLKAEKAKETPEPNRIGALNFYIQAASINKAGEQGVDALKEAIQELEGVLAVEDSVATQVSEYASLIARYDEALSDAFLEGALESFAKSESELRQSVAKSLEGELRFRKLVGNEMVVEGLFLDKTEIDWNSYRGKVVLVDFWATWCGPCLGEIPNVQALYEKYHDAGFEVVGYSLDNDLEALEKFEEERKLPWKTLSRELTRLANEEDGKNYKLLSEYYGVRAIPTMILVGKDGKAIDTAARGARLKELLEKEFPEVK